MSATATYTFKPLSRADSCLLSLPSIFTSKPPYQCLSVPHRPIKLRLSYSSYSLSSLSLKPKTHFCSFITFVAQTSDWTQREEEGDSTITLTESEQEEPTWENKASDGAEAQVSDWEADGEDAVVEAVGSDGESVKEGGFEEADTEEGFVEPPEDAKIFVGNLPYDVDSQKLAMLFEQAGTVEIAEVIYNRETDSSRGFGFVTMSVVEEAEKAVEMFHRYDLNGRLLTVNKAAPRGSRPERPPRVYEPAFRIYVGNLPWDLDNARLEQVFSEHGKVVDARVVYDRETGRSRGFGFVTMSTEIELNDAIAALDGQTLDGRAIRVNVAEERPRRNSF
ncbi:hypothetical protein P3X46_030907 [Hevea brasiliensis]|uniref:RRM domain-containing protein n=1 Tax=Hevea brasiliensis TaxID=3981 RepID=A0ABQ9KLR6_HEVBR|nr:28 kDa ribonucleoprotein, chloroplastic [Hevea brasiliensis]KAJ9140235.1 hypothetical protein P3X46_030907 [Hevea brasiliensis]